jgi:reactive intermediate/imine deaminase
MYILKQLIIVLLFIFSVNTNIVAQQNPINTTPFNKTFPVNDLIFISGQIGIDEATGKLVTSSFEAEAVQVMKNIEMLLKNEGLDFSDVANVTIYLKNMNNYQLTNKVYSAYFHTKFPARVCVAVMDLPFKANIEISAIAARSKREVTTSKEIVKQFLEQVRSGKNPENARLFMTDTVLAYQMNSENQEIIKRTPQNYTDHIREFLKTYGNYSFEITELLADGDRVYARWLQVGKHLSEIDGHTPTGKPLIEIASCVYRVENHKIVEYWIQADRLGFEKQLERNK